MRSRAELQPRVDVRPNKFVWLGCTVPYDAFTFISSRRRSACSASTRIAISATGSTFIVECREDTWRAAGLDTRRRRSHGRDPRASIFADRARRPQADQEPLDLAKLPDRALRQVARRQRRAARRRRPHRALLDRLGHEARDGRRDRAARRAARARATSRPRSPPTKRSAGPRSRRCRPPRRRASSGSRAPSAT